MVTKLNGIAADVAHLPVGFANVYFLGRPEPGEDWFVIDTGVPGSARKILAAAEARFGPATRPRAILLTHGHFDHAGSALELADFWGVPVLAHPLELPYLRANPLIRQQIPRLLGSWLSSAGFMACRC